MKIVNGDLLALFEQGDFNAIAHGCNCFNCMGGGIALQIAKKYPEAYEADRQTIKGDINKLGTLTSWSKSSSQRIYNLYTQYKFGSHGVFINYDALSLALYKLNILEKGKRVGIPLIGGGLAGGDPLLIQAIMDRQLKDCDATLVLWDGPAIPKRDYTKDTVLQGFIN